MLVSAAIQNGHEYYGLHGNTAPLTPLADGDVVLDDMIQSFGPDFGVLMRLGNL